MATNATAQAVPWGESVLYTVPFHPGDSFRLAYQRANAAAAARSVLPSIWKLGPMSQPDTVCLASTSTDAKDLDFDEFDEDDGEPMPMEVLQGTIRDSDALEESDTLFDTHMHIPCSSSASSAIKANSKAQAVEERREALSELRSGSVAEDDLRYPREWRAAQWTVSTPPATPGEVYTARSGDLSDGTNIRKQRNRQPTQNKYADRRMAHGGLDFANPSAFDSTQSRFDPMRDSSKGMGGVGW
ncbi:hypothetical protein LTR08_000482 [Meristemomyces frigidus]|nr:hypothetical protein LTR08_000482 [Meristemomyces frigidus]